MVQEYRVGHFLFNGSTKILSCRLGFKPIIQKSPSATGSVESLQCKEGLVKRSDKAEKPKEIPTYAH
ncbi:hypothetical protein H5410_017442 [Solanum commersonii]|uniref:Uncharacterized protein n=1 Tax=Solanum commersonii TaxID=4109 RepID=A0A9J6A003_SOLCO|nr:hypothetical protein H5410_017442 [Solanum commersonii]